MMAEGGFNEHFLERAVFNTIRYFDIFGMPVTAMQIWRSLIVSSDGGGVRWQGSHVFSLGQVDEILHESEWLKEQVVRQWGYWGMKVSMGESEDEEKKWVRKRLIRHALAQRKWKIARRAVWWMGWIPFVRMVGVTGSLSLDNTRPESDLDLLVVVKSGRIWTARILMLMTVQLLGCRRKHWDREAPDKICLNHIIVDDKLVMAKEIRTLYTAVLYSHLRLLVGMDTYKKWWEENGQWIRKYLMMPEVEVLESRHAVKRPIIFKLKKGWLEGILLEPIGDGLERYAEKVQRKLIDQHARGSQGGRVVVSDEELAFHPDSKEDMVLNAFAQEPGQERLL